jgi:hypothetical protein
LVLLKVSRAKPLTFKDLVMSDTGPPGSLAMMVALSQLSLSTIQPFTILKVLTLKMLRNISRIIALLLASLVLLKQTQQTHYHF